MTIGKKIKQLRLQKGITQEVLADYLNISFQAVSKWENDTASPDISLLPQLSIYFGITIDDLFEVSKDDHLERIENMLDNQRALSPQDESYIRDYLLNLLEHKDYKAKSHGLLAGLYNHRAKSHHENAEFHALEALKLDPTNKANHVALIEAKRGVFTDWNYTNHYKLCAFYKAFTLQHPTYRSGYLYLLDHLIADGRLTEAKEELKRLKAVDSGYIYNLYEGKIHMRSGHPKNAFECWDEMVKTHGHEWLAYASRADEYALTEQFDLALSDYEQAMKLQNTPRYYDGYEAMAHLYEIKGDHAKSIDMWQQVIALLADEWDIKTGELVDYPNREIARLNQIQSQT